MTLHTLVKHLVTRVYGSPDYDRLSAAIAETKIERDRKIEQSGGDASAKPWAGTADQFLVQAENNLKGWNIQQGWVSLMSAQRALLSDPGDPDGVRRVAIRLRRESEKASGWRAKAIADLICGPRGDLRDELKDSAGTAITQEVRDRVIDAVALRDDQFSTTYFKILLRRRSLIQLFLALWLAILICVVLAAVGVMPKPFDNGKEVAAVVLFGVLGACLSVGQGLLNAEVSAKIPAQQIGSFVVWMRPGIGAGAALLAYGLIHANATLKFFSWMSTDFGVVVVIAFAAGYSERFILGAIEQISQVKS